VGVCRTHYLRNLLTKVPKAAQPWVATLVRTVFDQPAADAVTAHYARVMATIAEKFPAAAEHLDDARGDLLAFTSFPREMWRQIWSNNPQERLNKEIRRRTDVVGIFLCVLLDPGVEGDPESLCRTRSLDLVRASPLNPIRMAA
jgi:putative transposase